VQNDDLTLALYDAYQRTGRELHRWAAYFLRALRRHGGLKESKRILGKPVGKITAGFQALLDAGRPELSVEAIVLAPKFRPLFTPAELATARERLKRFPRHCWPRTVDVSAIYPDELPGDLRYFEGAVSKVKVNRYERDPAARHACLAKYGARCHVCNLKFEERYGEIGKGFIHVHHLKPLGTMRKQYRINPTLDLIPVCPNCHAMLHTKEPPISIDDLKQMLRT
jgi:5-methylcytosine-specific restriction protein A